MGEARMPPGEGRRWLEAWQAADTLLTEERWNRVRALDDDSAWAEAQGLAALWEPGWSGDAGEELILHQRVFARGRSGDG